MDEMVWKAHEQLLQLESILMNIYHYALGPRFKDTKRNDDILVQKHKNCTSDRYFEDKKPG